MQIKVYMYKDLSYIFSEKEIKLEKYVAQI